jgi:hypothetical protein
LDGARGIARYKHDGRTSAMVQLKAHRFDNNAIEEAAALFYAQICLKSRFFCLADVSFVGFKCGVLMFKLGMLEIMCFLNYLDLLSFVNLKKNLLENLPPKERHIFLFTT